MNEDDNELDPAHEEMATSLDIWADEHGKTVPSPSLIRALIFKAIDTAYSCAPTHYKAMSAIHANLTDAIMIYEEAFDTEVNGP